MSNAAASTQDHLPIAGIQDGVLIMNDASIRVVLKVEPINFDLKSEAEQNSIIYGYQGFLNSLDFPIQIVVHSRKLDLERYLINLETSQKNISNDLLRIQVEDYVGFIRRLISVANIMSKRFYLIISYNTVNPSGGISPIPSLLHKPSSTPVYSQENFDQVRSEAINRANIVASGLGRLGNQITMLTTQELIEMFYSVYNPDIATEERLTNVEMIEAGIITNPQALLQPDQASEIAPVPGTPATNSNLVTPDSDQTPVQQPLEQPPQ